MNENQRTIYYYEHYNLLDILFGERDNNIDRIRICENMCSELISSIFVSPLKKTAGQIELDKSSEIDVATKHQATRSTQLATALMYLLFGLYANLLPSSKLKQAPDYDIHIL
jgi:hypothetical protein